MSLDPFARKGLADAAAARQQAAKDATTKPAAPGKPSATPATSGPTTHAIPKGGWADKLGKFELS